MLAVPDGLRLTVFETDHVMFPMVSCQFPIKRMGRWNLPVANMVSELYTKDGISLVVSDGSLAKILAASPIY